MCQWPCPPRRLKVEEVTLPKVSVKLLPGFGVQLNLHTKVGLHGSGWVCPWAPTLLLPTLPPWGPLPYCLHRLTPSTPISSHPTSFPRDFCFPIPSLDPTLQGSPSRGRPGTSVSLLERGHWWGWRRGCRGVRKSREAGGEEGWGLDSSQGSRIRPSEPWSTAPGWARLRRPWWVGPWPPSHAPSFWSRSPLGGLLQLAAEVNVSSRVALGVSARGTPILILKRCSTLLGHISLLTGWVRWLEPSLGGSRRPDLMGLPGVSLASWAGLEFTLPLPLSPHQPIAQTCKLRPTTDKDSGPAPQFAMPAPEHPTSPAPGEPASLLPGRTRANRTRTVPSVGNWVSACSMSETQLSLWLAVWPQGIPSLVWASCPYLYNEHLNLRIPKSLAPLYPPHSRRSVAVTLPPRGSWSPKRARDLPKVTHLHCSKCGDKLVSGLRSKSFLQHSAPAPTVICCPPLPLSTLSQPLLVSPFQTKSHTHTPPLLGGLCTVMGDQTALC